MRRKANYFVSCKNILTILASVFATAAVVGFILNMICGRGENAGTAYLWFRCILPTLAAIHFVLTILVHGKDRLYRIAGSYWLLSISLIYIILNLGTAWYLIVLMILAQLLSAVGVTYVVSGKTKLDWLLILLVGAPLLGTAWFRAEVILTEFHFQEWLGFLPTALFLIAYILLNFAMHAYPDDGTYRKTWGDRSDGRRIRSLDPISTVGVYIMPDRNSATNMFKDKLEITNLERYIREKKVAGYDGFGMTIPLLAAYVRTVAKYPALNRFISGQKIYSRDEDIQFCMTVKKEMSTEAPDTIIKLHLNPTDTAMDVYKKFNEAVMEVRKTQELDSEFDNVAGIVGAIPGILLKFVVWFLKLLDYFGLLPKFLLEVSPFHGSVYFTSMGSLGVPAIYHHLYNFGNIPMFYAFGCKTRVKELDDAGNMVERKYMDYSFVMDERTVDGFYYAAAVKYFQKLLRHPEVLDEKIEDFKHDIP